MKYFAFVILVIVFSGCNKEFLDKRNPASVTYGDVYKNKNDFNTALAGCYSSMANTVTTTILLGEILSDNVFVSKYSLTSPWALLDHYTISSENDVVGDYWFSNYRSIQRSNILIDRVKNAVISDSEIKIIELEAKFIRAFSYYNLLRSFGGVPLYLQEVDIDQTFDKPRSSENDISDAIISDLNEVLMIDQLRSGDVKTTGRITTDVAKMLLSKLYLWNHDYAKAENILKDIIDSDHYFLSDFDELYSADFNGNSEIIFGIFYDRVSGFGSPFAASTVPYNQIGIYPNIDRYFGSGLCNIENYFMSKFTSSDKRKTLCDTAIFRSLSSTLDTNIYSIKYVDPLTTADGFSGSNTIIFRYADVLLMYADVLVEKGELNRSIDYINMVRHRSNLHELVGNFSKLEIKDIISNERQKEFILEGDRWFDLRYRGIEYFRSEINDFKHHAVLTKNIEVYDHFNLLPIPSSEILLKPILEQNPGY